MTLQEAYNVLGLDASTSSPKVIRATYRNGIKCCDSDAMKARLCAAFACLQSQNFPRLLAGTWRRQQAQIDPDFEAWRRQQAEIDPDFEAWRRSSLPATKSSQRGWLYSDDSRHALTTTSSTAQFQNLFVVRLYRVALLLWPLLAITRMHHSVGIAGLFGATLEAVLALFWGVIISAIWTGALRLLRIPPSGEPPDGRLTLGFLVVGVILGVTATAA